jgi:hypothetical protein
VTGTGCDRIPRYETSGSGVLDDVYAYHTPGAPSWTAVPPLVSRQSPWQKGGDATMPTTDRGGHGYATPVPSHSPGEPPDGMSLCM